MVIRFRVRIEDPVTGEASEDENWEVWSGGGESIRNCKPPRSERRQPPPRLDEITLRGPMRAGRSVLTDWIRDTIERDDWKRNVTITEILDDYVLERTDEFKTFMAVGDQTYLDAEKNLLGLDHAEIAGNICKKWFIPDSITQGIRWHHHPARSDSGELALIQTAAGVVVPHKANQRRPQGDRNE